jgi:oxygen-independent coproporphyrinogen-3 oxidase
MGVWCEPRAAYIHVPFCAHRCGYCDFTLVAGRDDLIDVYLQALEIELQSLERPRAVDTLFFGGGTPTHLSAEQLARLMTLVLHWFQLTETGEFSVEANPASLTHNKIKVLADAGVNRVSLGVQSFDPQVLALLERDHRREGILRTVDRLRPHIANISFDLIFGVPRQTLQCWRETLRQAIELAPQHISTYGLTFEKGTSFWTRREKGFLVELGEELERDMYATAMDDLTAGGFEQYELSNFAKPGYRCRHNAVYWKGLPYYGFGPGAGRYVNGRRETNQRSVTAWIERTLQGESAVGEAEELSDEDRAREAIVLGLRNCAGIDRDEFEALTGYDLDELAGDAIAKNCLAGLLEETESHVRLTRDGRFLADTVLIDFL